MDASSKVTLLLLPDAPDIPGLRFRGFRDAADYAAMAEIFAVSRELDGLDFVMTAEDFRRQLAHMPHCAPETDLFFAEVHGEIIAHSFTSWTTLGDGTWTYTTLGLLKPAWRRQGIGSALLRHSEQHLREIARGHPVDAPKFYERGALEREVGLKAMLERLDYTPARYGFSMLRPCAEPVVLASMPPGLELRPVAADELDKVFAAADEAFRDHWGYSPELQDELKGWMEYPSFNPALWMLAWDGDELAGMVLNYVDEAENELYQRRRGYTETIAVRQPWRRRGLARALLTRSIQQFIEMGMEETALGVDAENSNHALDLYEAVGYRLHETHTTYRKPLLVV